MLVTVNIQLPDKVAEQARSLGVLTDETMAELITAEIERRRKDAAARLSVITEQLQANFRAEYGDLTDDEAQALIDQWIAEADEETPRKDDAPSQ